MSMEEWPDDHLDELFRKSAEEFDIPVNNADWDKMSRLLDKHDWQLWFDRMSRWGGIGALVLLLLGGLGRMMLDGKAANGHQEAVIMVLSPGKQGSDQLAKAGQPDRVATRSNTSTTTDLASSTEFASQPMPVGESSGPLTDRVRETNPAEHSATKRIDDQAVKTGTSASRRVAEAADGDVPGSPVTVYTTAKKAELAVSVARSAIRLPGQRSGRNRAIALADKRNLDVRLLSEKAIAHPIKNSVVEPTATYPSPSGNVPASRLANKPEAGVGITTSNEQHPATPDNLAVQWLPVITQVPSLSNVIRQERSLAEVPPLEQAVAVPTRPAIVRQPRLSVMLFASPDLSGVGLTNFDRPGTNAGLAVQYQLTDRLSINTGAMYSTKRYQSYSANYVWPSYMNMEVWPEEISGVCKMVDIPLNIRYDWLLRRRGDGRAPARWFTSAGITSYFIQHEVYSYEYANPADPKIKSWGWDNQKAGRAGGSFGFSNLNISIGYERPITNRLSWQVEPFMKVPLKQVGYFKVRLLSTGAFIGLRYRL